jgi:hypothetical protein
MKEKKRGVDFPKAIASIRTPRPVLEEARKIATRNQLSLTDYFRIILQQANETYRSKPVCG